MLSTALVIFTVVSSLLALFSIRKKRSELIQNKNRFLKVFLYGLSLLLFALIGNSMISKNWDIDFLLAFLTVKDTGEWFFRYLLPFAYMGIVIGAGSLLILTKK